jgi:hypothetical protein
MPTECNAKPLEFAPVAARRPELERVLDELEAGERAGDDQAGSPGALDAGPASLRTLARATDGITAKVFSMLNELAVEAVRSRKEQITDEDVESWKPALEREAVFA